jgi:hypothetical protein
MIGQPAGGGGFHKIKCVQPVAQMFDGDLHADN